MDRRTISTVAEAAPLVPALALAVLGWWALLGYVALEVAGEKVVKAWKR
jgi:hypothetical protein